MAGPRLILASSSPRRRELLATLGASFDCDPAEIDETPLVEEKPRDYVLRMAQEKARVVLPRYPDPNTAVLGADTAVVIDNEILGKPRDYAGALAMLTRLGGNTHSVFTAVCLVGTWGDRCAVVVTEVEFAALSSAECQAYLATDEPWDKAGAYAIQGLGGALVKGINGSYSNVVGLPLFETRQLLSDSGIATLLVQRASDP